MQAETPIASTSATVTLAPAKPIPLDKEKGPTIPPTPTAPAEPTPVIEPPKDDKPATKQKDTKSKPIPQKIKYTVSNLNNIGITNRTSKDFDAGPTPTESKPIGTYFDSLEIKRKLVTDKGTFFTIDGQPDMRFFTYYSAFKTAQLHEKIVIDNFTYVSIPSLIGYKLAILTAELLIVDLHARKTKSSYSTVFEDNTILKSTLSLLMSCKVPTDVLIPLEKLALFVQILSSNRLWLASTFTMTSAEHFQHMYSS